ncbi:benzoate 1,2-dioxygenase electron transfer component BenC [Bradyrhizobium erythrophlei]|uniref:Benzoate/toluate 1,2-dioxygenase reductase subunit n=1 Tax=Bradyrhizobium erythrophlei TaxID=1437360 RepID=A0A1M5VHB1_9BRAD|nr:benzoate 1,2-dioxygenase electron transfer component BenC [Bradyrhizobium erythrophlei]SHH74600.1 benzoate/toluate 1,2-dioxygenase reductase subunit [Bradyrhizobium erythrophlei]
MLHKIALNFEDGITKFIDAAESESIADAAYRQGINVPLDCTNGVCGTCKAFCQSGAFNPGSYIEDALSDSEAAEGYVLCCQAKAKSDMVIDVLASSGACKVKPKNTMAEIVKVEALSAHRIRLSAKPLDGVLPMFLPGQYVNVTASNETVTRPYSLTSAPGADVATFMIRNVPGGKMSAYLEAKAKAGDRLLLNGPFGSFYLRAPRRSILFLAGGTGVGPILSMLEHLAARGANDQPVQLVYGARDDADLVEVERIEALAARIPKFAYHTTCSGPGSRHPLTGHVTDHFADGALNGDVDVYLCGPPEMVESGRQHVAKLGISSANVHFEKFVPASEVLAV